MPKRYWHYCCSHSINGILKNRGMIIPNPHPGRQPVTEARAKAWGFEDLPVWVYPVVWVTDVDVHSREDALLIGLGQVEGNLTDCFRVEYRFVVPNVGLQTWREWADANVGEELAEHRKFLESGYGVDPTRWWVSPRPITGCRLDQGYQGVQTEKWGPIGH